MCFLYITISPIDSIIYVLFAVTAPSFVQAVPRNETIIEICNLTIVCPVAVGDRNGDWPKTMTPTAVCFPSWDFRTLQHSTICVHLTAPCIDKDFYYSLDVSRTHVIRCT